VCIILIERDFLKRGYNIFVGDIKLRKVDYYTLPRDKMWLKDGDNPYQMGGRDTDVAQIAYALRDIVKERYPINGVPSGLKDNLDKLKDTCEDCEKKIEESIEIISGYLS